MLTIKKTVEWHIIYPMGFLGWMALAGGLLMLMALSSTYLKWLPITTSTVYLLAGFLLGPAIFSIIAIDFIDNSIFFEHITEIVVIVSLFIDGLKLRLPLNDPAWRAAFRLAGPVMIASIVGVAAISHYLIGLPWPAAFLLGALLAPTDPVLASAVSVENAADHDRTRYGLSGEAGFNDGAAFPFVVFGLLWLEYGSLDTWVGEWALHRLLWAVPAGLMLGFIFGKVIGRFSLWLRHKNKESKAPNDFLALALLALSYTFAESIGAWGFLAAFGAGLGFRRAELNLVEEQPSDPKTIQKNVSKENSGSLPADQMFEHTDEDLEDPKTAAGVVISEIISFGDSVERLLEVFVIVLVGVCLASYWDWRAIPLALILFLIIRPLAVMFFLIRTPTFKFQRAVIAWFGIRGIGSIYYLSYAVTHGLKDNVSEIVGLTFSVVGLSILIHGITSQPLLSLYESKIEKA